MQFRIFKDAKENTNYYNIVKLEMNNISDKRKNFKVQIRRKSVKDRMANLRASLYQFQQNEQREYSDQKIRAIIQGINQQNLGSQLHQLERASHFLNSQNIYLFESVVSRLYEVIQNFESFELKDTNRQKTAFYNQILNIFINVSSEAVYKWPNGSYLAIIKGLIDSKKQMNTMWLLSNLLHQKNQVSTSLTEELINYDCISFCENRLKTKFSHPQQIILFAYFVCGFLSNSQILSFQCLKKVIVILEQMCNSNTDGIDWIVMQSLIDHAPFVRKFQFQIFHSKLLETFTENYCKKKKTKFILEQMEFFKIFLYSETDYLQSIEAEGQRSKAEHNSYERISKFIIPVLQICSQNKSPEVKAYILQMCALLLNYYFPYVDLENQQIYLTLSTGLHEITKSPLIKFSNKALLWQIRFNYVFLQKIRDYKLDSAEIKEMVSEVITSDQILDSLLFVLEEKQDQREIIYEAVNLLMFFFHQFGIGKSIQEEKLDQFIEILENILAKDKGQDESLYFSLEKLIEVCQTCRK